MELLIPEFRYTQNRNKPMSFIFRNKSLILLVLLLQNVISLLQSQPVSLPLSRDLLQDRKPLNDTLHGFHASVKPFLADEMQAPVHRSFYTTPADTGNGTSPFRLTVRPLTAFSTGYENKFLYDAGIGTEFLLTGKKSLSFDFRYMYHAAVYPSLYDSLTLAGYVPGYGKAFNTGPGRQLQWGSLTGAIAWMPLRQIILEAGIGKHFWGEGYRSLFLSDNGNAWPYVKTTVRVWHIKYVSLLGFMQDVNLPGSLEKLYPKYGAFHYLSWNVSRRVNLSFFEAVVWNGNDSIRRRGYDFQYMIPVVVYRPVEHWIGSPDNVLLGAAGSYTFLPGWSLYAQFLLDELVVKEFFQGTGWAGNKYAMQFGIKAEEPFDKRGLHLLAEVNLARPYTWSHRNTLNNYGAWYQPLAHPLGANFVEALAELRYAKGMNRISGLLSFVAAGQDTGSFNAGYSVYRNYTSDVARRNVPLLQGERVNQALWSIEAGRMVMPRFDLFAGLQFSGRYMQTGRNHSTAIFLGVSLRTLLQNDTWWR